nr:hypothetical protein [Tanacetum cinerariifolium]
AAADFAARHHAAAHYSLLGLQRADCADVAQLGNPGGIGPLRCGQRVYSPRPRGGAGRFGAAAEWWQAQANNGG